MRPFLSLLLSLGVCATAIAQINIPSQSAPHTPIVATCEAPAAGEAGSVQILWESDPATQFLAVDGGATLHVWSPPGEHYIKASVFAVDWESRTFQVTQHRASFRVGGETPTPPEPEPEPDPPTPEPPAKVTAVIIHESADDTPAFSRLVTSLRTGERAKWLADGGHELLVLDDDATDIQGQPLDLVATLNALGATMPALFVLDGTKVLLQQTLADTATGQDVLDAIKGVLK